MLDLFSQMTLAGRSMGASRVVSATASHNVENASTEGYSRQRADLVTNEPSLLVAGVGFMGTGVAVGGIGQLRDRFIEAQMPAALGSAAAASSRSSVLQPISALDPSGAGTLTDSMADFFAAVRQVSVDPQRAGARQAAIASARSLAHTFRSAAADIDAKRDAIDLSVKGTADEVNRLAATVASLNHSIQVAGAGGEAPNDLLDARQKALDALAEKTGATWQLDNGGNANVMLPGAGALVSGSHAGSLSTQPDPQNSGHLQVLLTATDGSTKRAVNIDGGAIGGFLHARDVDLKRAGDDVDSLAFNLGNALNTVHRAGTALDGTSGRDLFTVGATAAGAAANFTVDAAVDADPSLFAASATGAVGDGAQALALAQVESTSGAPDSLAAIVSQYGGAVASATSDAATSGAVKDTLVGLRESASGVSIDEEMIEITKAQRAFEASTKVIQTADQMLQDLLNIAGRG